MLGIGEWGLRRGDWGVGIGAWGLRRLLLDRVLSTEYGAVYWIGCCLMDTALSDGYGVV